MLLTTRRKKKKKRLQAGVRNLCFKRPQTGLQRMPRRLSGGAEAKLLLEYNSALEIREILRCKLHVSPKQPYDNIWGTLTPRSCPAWCPLQPKKKLKPASPTDHLRVRTGRGRLREGWTGGAHLPSGPPRHPEAPWGQHGGGQNAGGLLPVPRGCPPPARGLSPHTACRDPS